MAIESFRVEGLKGVLDTLKQLPPELVSKGGGPVRSALRKAALVIQKQALANLQSIIDQPNADGLPAESTGLLAKNVVVQRIKPPSGKRGERYMIRVRKKKYDGNAEWKPRTTAQIGALLEYGTERRGAMPWMMPAFEAKRAEAAQVFERELPAAIARIVRKLAKQNRVA